MNRASAAAAVLAVFAIGACNSEPTTAPLSDNTATGSLTRSDSRSQDNDGDEDIVLGSYFQTVGEMTKLVFKGIEVFPQLLILSNQKK